MKLVTIIKCRDLSRKTRDVRILPAGISRLLLAFNLIFFLAFPIIDGPVLGVDTAGYINMDTSREALYPLFLASLRGCCEHLGIVSQPYGQPAYLFVAALLQCLLAAVVTWRFSVLVAELGKHPILFAWIATLCQWGTVLLQRFGSKRGACYQEVILTEGLALSFYLMFLIALVKMGEKVISELNAISIRDFGKLGVTVFLCVSIRKQLLMVVFCAFFAAVFLSVYLVAQNEYLIKDVIRKFLAPLVVTLVIAAVFSNGMERIYNYARFGLAETHTGSSMGIDCTLIYISDEDDENLFEDPEIGEMFSEIRKEAKEQDALWNDDNYGDWYRTFYHFGESYDVIGYDIMNPILSKYMESHYDVSSMSTMEYYKVIDEIEDKIKNTLLMQHPLKYLYIWHVNFRQGLAVSVLKSHHVLNYFITFLYALYLGMFFHLGIRHRKEEQRILLFAFFVGLGLVVNIAIVSAVIFMQTRYAIYVMSSFYTALLLMTVEESKILLNKLGERKRQRSEEVRT